MIWEFSLELFGMHTTGSRELNSLLSAPPGLDDLTNMREEEEHHVYIISIAYPTGAGVLKTWELGVSGWEGIFDWEDLVWKTLMIDA